MGGQTFANQLNMNIYKEISAQDKKIHDAVEGILTTMIEPWRGLTEEIVEEAKS
eukprot:CAMPEP_0116880756 /NCGR_PEP_ID=MMETSP0463-20121206/12737_1 /TAXON_ID=181622 /ORGANISM="Strombidinopsis sp, Strain SopsisLIS2011" /LENGTH=53 /DNA_ID=CAMNT_0004531757 /DNA_START=1640 /DNA_END=1801 /DNA_ORIENTATION=+